MNAVKDRISFVIASRDEDPLMLDATIHGLLATSRGWAREIIVVDDGSQIPIRVEHSEVTVKRNPFPMGVSRSRRLGCSVASGDVFVVLDPHMSFNHDWLDHMLEYLEPNVLLCAAWMNYARTNVHCWGSDLVWNGGFEFAQRGSCPRVSIVEVPLVVGACYMLHRRAYEKIGGFSPLFRVWGVDEQDISIRAWMAELKVKCVTRAGVGHLDRDRNPNPVYGEHVKHNQLALIRTVFEEATVPLLEEFIAPVSPQVERWLDRDEVAAWRSDIQSRREMSDAEFFLRFVKKSPLHFGKTVRVKRGHSSPGGLISAVKREEMDLTIRLQSEGIKPLKYSSGSFQPNAFKIPQQRDTFPDMVHVDGLDVEAGITFQAFGVRLGIRVAHAALLGRVMPYLPWGWEPCTSPEVDMLYSLTSETERGEGVSCTYHALYKGNKRQALTTEVDEMLDALEAGMESDVAEMASRHVFVQSGVVAWKNRAILILGNELCGKRALVTALVRAGADYYSDKFAVFDAEGHVHPYARPIVLHSLDQGQLAKWSVEALGGRTGSEGIPVGLVVITHHKSGSRWRPRKISPAETLSLLLLNAFKPREKSEMTFNPRFPIWL